MTNLSQKDKNLLKKVRKDEIKPRKLKPIPLSDFQLGDVLIYLGRNPLVNKGQMFTKKGNRASVHAGIVVDKDIEWYVQRVFVAEAVDGTKVFRRQIETTFKSQDGIIFVYRCPEREGLATLAAAIALNWSQDGRTQDYSTARATRSALGSAKFGKNAKRRAVKFAARRSKNTPTLQAGIFCSMFVVACYQAAGLCDTVKSMGNRKISKFKKSTGNMLFRDEMSYLKKNNTFWTSRLTNGMCIDAKFATPRRLMGELDEDTDNWQCMGYWVADTLVPQLEDCGFKPEKLRTALGYGN